MITFPLKFSKRVQSGMMVSLRGGKFVRCGRAAYPFGIVQAAARQRVLTNDGWQLVDIPAGVVTYGPVTALVSR